MRPKPPVDEVAQLVDHRRVAVRGQDVQQRLRRDDLADRRRERRRADLGAHLDHLVEHLVEPAARRLAAQLHVERRDEADRQLVLRGAHGDPWRERRHRLVADVLVDEIGRLPEAIEVDARVEAEPGQRLRRRLGRDAVHRQRDRDRRRSRSGRRLHATLRSPRPARCRPLPARRGRPADPRRRAARRRARSPGAAAGARRDR